MKTFYTGLISMGLAAVLVGCDHKTEPGGPGATQGSNSKGVGLGQPDNTFELKMPGSMSVRQGETKSVELGISRGKNFDQDVRLEFTGVPQGVTLTPANQVFKHSTDKEMVTVMAGPDAALGEHTVTVTGTPLKGGAKTTGQIKIDVKKP